jgi:hypothetical protein
VRDLLEWGALVALGPIGALLYVGVRLLVERRRTVAAERTLRQQLRGSLRYARRSAGADRATPLPIPLEAERTDLDADAELSDAEIRRQQGIIRRLSARLRRQRAARARRGKRP